MGMFDRTRKGLLDSYHGKTSVFGALASPPTFHVGLSSTEPASDGSNITEPSGGSYARVATVAGDWNVATEADPAITDNGNAATFPVPTADWLSGVEIGYWVRWDAATVGNALDWGTVPAPRKVLNGDPAPSFPIGALSSEMGDE